jgi:hypothetical protein
MNISHTMCFLFISNKHDRALKMSGLTCTGFDNYRILRNKKTGVTL